MQRWIQRATRRRASLWLAAAPAIGCALGLPGDALAQSTVPEQSAPSAASSDGLVTLGQDLTLTVAEDGPNQPWTITLANRGSEPLAFLADPGLLWFDVTLPGRATQSCSLPEPLRPTALMRKSVLVLHPGEQYSRRLDPRFFCFAELGQVLLVPGAKVTPNFGWWREPVTTKSRSSAARRAAADSDTARFVAWRISGPAAEAALPARPSSPLEGSTEEEPTSTPVGPRWRMPTEGLRSVQGATLELPESYSAWTGPVRRDAPRDIELVLLAGSDAEDERNATISFSLINTLDHPQQIFVRRELLEYDVQGPDGFFVCPSADVGSPDFASFSTLPPHGAERAVVRLIEVCPRRSFARPGLYEVRARLVARASGQDLGLDAFVGELETMRPAFVRVRSGDRSSFARLVVPAVVPGARNAAGSAAAADGTPEAPPAEEAPGEAPTPDEAPATPDQPAPPEAPPVE